MSGALDQAERIVREACPYIFIVLCRLHQAYGPYKTYRTARKAAKCYERHSGEAVAVMRLQIPITPCKRHPA